MSWLARLKKTENTPDREPTKPTKGAFVGFVAPVEGVFPENGVFPAADEGKGASSANLPSTAVSQAQAAKLANLGEGRPSSTAQICAVSQDKAANLPVEGASRSDDQHAARVDFFIRRGLRVKDAEQLAEQVYRRALDLDDRRLCLECRHLSGKQCSRASYAGAGRVVEAIARLPQRCPVFEGAL